jgi:predicted 3-demethylubiquinone-9 3-methyltransferase (glyoxalase superfamily)
MRSIQKITPYLWFNGNAEEAVEFYTSVFPDSRVTKVARWGEGGPGAQGTVMSIAFELASQRFFALNGGPQFTFTPAVSLFVSCESQAEVDELWEKLLAGGGKPTACGWLQDRYGLSWQVIPTALADLMSDPDPKVSGRVAQALMRMQKIDLAVLQQAHAAAA